MTIEYSEDIVVKNMIHGIPVTIVVEYLEIPKTLFADAFKGIYIHSILGEYAIKNRKDFDKASKGAPESEISFLPMNLNDAKRLCTVLARVIETAEAGAQVTEFG